MDCTQSKKLPVDTGWAWVIVAGTSIKLIYCRRMSYTHTERHILSHNAIHPHIPSYKIIQRHKQLLILIPSHERSHYYTLSHLVMGVCHSPVDFRTHSRAYPHSLPRLSATMLAHPHSLPHMLMHEYLWENDKRPVMFCQTLPLTPSYEVIQRQIFSKLCVMNPM